MRITNIKSYIFEYPLENSVVTSFGKMKTRPALIIEIRSSDNISGFGEIWCNFPSQSAYYKQNLIHGLFIKYLKNIEFCSPREFYNKINAKLSIMLSQTGDEGIFQNIIAGFDIAVWDIFGKRKSKPINKILNKKFRTVFIKKNYSNQLDEQNILKSYGKLINFQNRDTSLKIAKKNKFDLAILDDGLQDKSISYDISIACFNSSSGIGNGFLLPAGPLRENTSILKNYDAIFLNGEKKNKKFSLILNKINPKPKIFEANYTPVNIKKFNLNKNFLFFCGIGNPDEFRRTLKKYKFKIKEEFIFPDHFYFSNKQINKIKEIARNKKLEIITTEKDYLRLNKENKKDIKFLKIILKIKNVKKFSKFLKDKI